MIIPRSEALIAAIELLESAGMTWEEAEGAVDAGSAALEGLAQLMVQMTEEPDDAA